MNYAKYFKKQLGKEWDSIEELNLNLDSKVLAELWSDFVNFEKRIKSEIPFLMKFIDKSSNVFDSSLGSGATTIGLKIKGINNIISNEIDFDLLKIAQIEADKTKVKIDTVSYDWRTLDNVYSEEFDVVLCLGNNLTYLFKKYNQLNALKNFKNLLKPNGKLIIDERNYAELFLKENKYKHSGDVLYCGKDKVSARPIFIAQNIVIMEYKHKEKKLKSHLVIYPFKKNELNNLLIEAGFKNIVAYGDYKKNFAPQDPEFITYVCKK